MSALAIDTAHTSSVPVGERLGADGTAPVLLLMHGYGSHEGDLTSLLPSLEHRGDWASLRAPLVLRRETPAEVGSYAWVPIERPGLPDPAKAAAATDAVLAWIGERVAPGARVIPIGFSQGGLMVTQLLRREPRRFQAGAVLSGFSLQGHQAGDDELTELRPPVFFGRGDRDAIIAEPTFARTSEWLAAHTTQTASVYAGLGHGISAQELEDLREFLRRI